MPRMVGTRVTGDSMDTLIAILCPPGARKSSISGKIQIFTINDLSLWVLLFNITEAAGTQSQHEATKTQLRLAQGCLNPTMFN